MSLGRKPVAVDWEAQLPTFDPSFDEQSFINDQLQKTTTIINTWSELLDPPLPVRTGSSSNLAGELEKKMAQLEGELKAEAQSLADELARREQEFRASLERKGAVPAGAEARARASTQAA